MGKKIVEVNSVREAELRSNFDKKMGIDNVIYVVKNTREVSDFEIISEEEAKKNMYHEFIYIEGEEDAVMEIQCFNLDPYWTNLAYRIIVKGKLKLDYVPNDDGKTFTIVVRDGVKSISRSDVLMLLYKVNAITSICVTVSNHGNHDVVIRPQYVEGVTAIKFPEGFECIEDDVFAPGSIVDPIPHGKLIQFTNLQTINIPKSLKYIGNKAFKNCNIQNVISEKDKFDSGIEIGYQAFANNKNLEEFNLSIASLGAQAFSSTEFSNKYNNQFSIIQFINDEVTPFEEYLMSQNGGECKSYDECYGNYRINDKLGR